MNRIATIAVAASYHNQGYPGHRGPTVAIVGSGAMTAFRGAFILQGSEAGRMPAPQMPPRDHPDLLPRAQTPWCCSTVVGLIAVIVGVLVLTGCSAPSIAPTAVPTWELANAEPFAPIPVGRGRLSFDRPLPAHLLQELCPEFTLVVIRTAKDWQDVRHRLQLATPPTNIDLSQGSIVGLVANVGESMDDRWPITFRCLRRRGTEGSLEAAFSPGVYYPMLTASYVDLVYAPGIRTIGLVAIDNRRFVIRSAAAH